MSSTIETLLQAAKYIEMQEQGLVQPYSSSTSSSSLGNSQSQQIPAKSISTSFLQSTTPAPSREEVSAPSLVVISRPNVQFTTHSQPQQHQVSIDLSSRNGPMQCNTITSNNCHTTSITKNGVTSQLFSVDESLNLSAESSGYISNSTNSSIGNISLNHSQAALELLGDFEKSSLELQKIQQQQTTFTTLAGSSSGRRRTISSNSNSGPLRSPSTVRAGTREVHNKLEKNRRAHLKECFESLKKQLPITADEKKTSNLSILGAAIRHIQLLKRKEREYEHEMERLAKEKISAQNRILTLKRELVQWDIDFSKLLPDTDISSIKSEKGEDQMQEIDTKSTSSLPSATSASIYNPPLNLSPNISPTNGMGVTSSSNSPMIISMPLNSAICNQMEEKAKITISPSTTTTIISPIQIEAPTNYSVQANYNLPVSAQTMPLNLHTSSIQSVSNGAKSIYTTKAINGMKNGIIKSVGDITKLTPKERYQVNKNAISNVQSQVTTTKLHVQDSLEPPTKLIKLINGSAILAPMEKDNKMLHSGQLTVSQVCAPIHIQNFQGLQNIQNIQNIQGLQGLQSLQGLQGLRVIGQSNGLTTIELSAPQVNGQHMQQRTINQSYSLPQATGAQLHKLLVNGATTTTNIGTLSMPMGHQQTRMAELSRLAGGAELNLLPANSNGTIYRQAGSKLAIMKDNSGMNRSTTSTASYVVTPIQSSVQHPITALTPIVVSQGQSANLTHIITSPSLTGKVMTTPLTMSSMPLITGAQYFSTAMMKPMTMMVSHQTSDSTVKNLSRGAN